MGMCDTLSDPAMLAAEVNRPGCWSVSQPRVVRCFAFTCLYRHLVKLVVSGA